MCRRQEWDYVNGCAQCKPNCTPGTRDANNDGKSVHDFRREINDLIRSRRAQGYGLQLPEQYAFLSSDEVIAVRLYTGPGYQLINGFLRSISTLSSSYRREIVQHPRLSMASTVVHLVEAIRKLSAIATEAEATAPLWRGVRGSLPRGFWTPDESGVICAVDMAFMSTSRQRQTPISYMGGSGTENVLWALRPSRETDEGYHYGADVSMLSQFEGEKEILFPPATMLVYGGAAGQGEQESLKSADGKSFVEIDVIPTFV